MDSPYATIIVPIIDRAETLAVGVATGLEQSRRDTEILIAGRSDRYHRTD